MTIDQIKTKVRCGACRRPIPGRLNLIQLIYRATWQYPVAGNILTGESGQAVSVSCDACIDGHFPVEEAIEITADGQIIYHQILDLASVEASARRETPASARRETNPNEGPSHAH